MLHKRSIEEKLLKGGAWAFAGKLVTAFSGLVISALLARLLTPEEMGAYFLTLSLVSIAAIVTQLGLTQTIVRLVAESMGTDRPSRARHAVLLVLRMVGFSGVIVACLLAFGAGQWVSEKLFRSIMIAQVMGLAVVWVVIISFQSLMAEVYRGLHDIRLATIFGGLSTSVISMGLFLVLWFTQSKSDLDQIIILTLGAGISSVLFSSVLLWNKLKMLPSDGDMMSSIEVMKISFPLWITSIGLFILSQVDLWIMGVYRSPEEVAIYGAATRTVALVTMPLLIVNAVVPPLIAEMYAQGKKKELEVALRKVATFAGIPSLLALVVFMFFGESILSLLFGDYYKSGFWALLILSLGQLINVWAGSCGLVLMLTGNQTMMMKITLFCGIITIFGAYFLVVDYGVLGVASAATIGTIIQNILMLVYAKKKVGIWTNIDFFILKRYVFIKLK